MDEKALPNSYSDQLMSINASLLKGRTIYRSSKNPEQMPLHIPRIPAIPWPSVGAPDVEDQAPLLPVADLQLDPPTHIVTVVAQPFPGQSPFALQDRG